MKSLTAILCILICTSAANAVYLQIDGNENNYIELTPDGTAIITIVSEDNTNWLGYLVIEDGGTGILSNVSIFDKAGNLASAKAYTETGWGSGYELIAAAFPTGEPAVSAGTQFSVVFADGSAGQTARISLYLDPDYTTAVSTITVAIVPETISLVLLGFGCLFLKRRRQT